MHKTTTTKMSLLAIFFPASRLTGQQASTSIYRQENTNSLKDCRQTNAISLFHKELIPPFFLQWEGERKYTNIFEKRGSSSMAWEYFLPVYHDVRVLGLRDELPFLIGFVARN